MCAGTRAELIKNTPLPELNIAVINLKLDDPFSLRPFQTRLMDGLTGHASPAVEFATLDAALLQHDALVRHAMTG